MKIRTLLLLAAFVMVLAGCDQHGVTSQGPREAALISKGFIDDNTWKVVCRGFPLEGLKGIQKSESSKRAALLGAYYYIKETFNESVAPDRDGKTERIEINSDHAVLYYVVHKKGLKKMLKPESKPEQTTGNKTE
jgi:hypothetical protein